MFLLFSLACAPHGATEPPDDDPALLDDTAFPINTAAPGSFAEVNTLLVANCGNCHHDEFLDRDDVERSYELLVTEVSRRQPRFDIVVPGDPDASLLLQKLLDDPPFGERMPTAYYARPEPLPEADIRLVRDWIVAGAEGP